MTQWLKRHIKTIIILIILIGASIAMAQFKQAYELSRDAYYENSFKLAQLIFFLTIAYVIFTFLFNKWKEYKALRNSHDKAQLELLKSKMDPHFFFNTLNNLYGLAIEKSDETAPVILKLSEVMRYTIYNGEKQKVTLREEVEHLRQYIEIHKIRYKDRVNICINENILDDQLSIAPLLFINLVENAFKHGAETLTAEAYIKIDIQSSGKKVAFTIENNKLPGISSEGGHGLAHLRERLALTYPRKHNFSIERTDFTYLANLELKIA